MVETKLSVLFLNNMVLLPYNEVRVELNSDIEKRVLNKCEIESDMHILVVSRDEITEKVNIKKLPKIAVLGKVKNKIELSSGTVRVTITGLDRVEVLNYIENEDNTIDSFSIPTKEYDYNESEADALKRILLKDLNDYIELSSNISNNVLGRINGINSLGRLTDIISFELPLNYLDKSKYIEIINPMIRIKSIIEDLNKEMETTKLENDLEDKLKNKLDEEQRNYILKEKIKLIKEELNEYDLRDKDISLLEEKLNSKEYPENIKTRIEEEIKRYSLTAETSPELSIIRNYIEWLLNMPWNEYTEDNTNIKEIQKELDKTHFGLDKIKERIIEYIAVSKIKNRTNPILCFIGPPGVGKTTLARSIANALNRKFVKISVGGIHDEGEIVGHRRTYIGANPGKIIQGIKRSKVTNPVFLIDEIDKLTKDYKGDPASALLDVLDIEQNKHFQDNYLEEEYDLSGVMFILTGNDEYSIPEALRDRLEIINLNSYTFVEKLEIAKKYIIPKLESDYGIKVSLTDSYLKEIILNYTKESGVRELGRLIDAIYRKNILNPAYKDKKISIETYLGLAKYKCLYNEKINEIGVVNTLGYTPQGGILLKTTTKSFNGTGNIILTGMLGDIIKESASVAIDYIKGNAKLLDIDERIFLASDYHIHFESASVPKEGPSAGVAIITSIISDIKKTPIDNSISMTGEITLRGKVLGVGDIKEKIYTAINNNIKTIYIPLDNKEEIKEIPSNILKLIKIKYINNYIEIFNDIF